MLHSSFPLAIYFTHGSVYIREGNGTPLRYTCLENPMDGGAWWAAVHGVTRSWTVHGVAGGQTRLSDFTFTFLFHALEKEMAPHSSVLAWRIPGTGEPGGCRLWGHTESDMTEATSKQQQCIYVHFIFSIPPTFPLSTMLTNSVSISMSPFLPCK